jgi:DNA-binding GntR family transcriptional regulator
MRHAGGARSGLREILLERARRILEAGARAIARKRHRDAVAQDVEFHSLLYERSGNPMIGVTAEPLWHYLRRVMITVLSYAERGDLVWEQHREILELWRPGMPSAAWRLVTEHIKGAQAAILGTIKDAPHPDQDVV